MSLNQLPIHNLWAVVGLRWFETLVVLICAFSEPSSALVCNAETPTNTETQNTWRPPEDAEKPTPLISYF